MLTETEKHGVVDSIRTLFAKRPINTVSELQEELNRKGRYIAQEALEGFLEFISSHADDPRMHLPNIVFDKEKQEIYDCS